LTANTIDYNSFLTLMIAEMKNQDPTSPTDPTQYVSQLATFSQVSQATQTNALLTSMLTNSALSQAESAIGHTVTSADGSVSGTVASVNITSTGGMNATLTNGKTLTLGSGITLS
jgi:flagellar basal-body rod modification protein FlgD